jgi:hypothetical protein
MGKLAHCLPVVAQPRLPGSAKPNSEALSAIHVAINDLAWSLAGYKREDHIPIEDLLKLAKFMLLNQLVVRATAMVCPAPGIWSASSCLTA